MSEYQQPQSAPYDIVARAASLVTHELSEQAPDQAIGHHTSMVMIQANPESPEISPALRVHLIAPGLEVTEKLMTTLTLTDLCPPPEAFETVIAQGLGELAKAIATADQDQ